MDDGIDLHHRTYVRMGDEWDEDLVPLCVSCHRLLHDYQKKMSLSVPDATDEFLRLSLVGSESKVTSEKKSSDFVPRHLRPGWVTPRKGEDIF